MKIRIQRSEYEKLRDHAREGYRRNAHHFMSYLILSVLGGEVTVVVEE